MWRFRQYIPCPNMSMSKLVRIFEICLNMSKLFRTFANMSEHVQTSSNIINLPIMINEKVNGIWFKIKSKVHIMYNFSSCFDILQQVQTCSDWFRIAYLWWSLKKSTAFDSIRSKVSCLLLKYTAKSVANMASSMHTITRL